MKYSMYAVPLKIRGQNVSYQLRASSHTKAENLAQDMAKR